MNQITKIIGILACFKLCDIASKTYDYNQYIQLDQIKNPGSHIELSQKLDTICTKWEAISQKLWIWLMERNIQEEESGEKEENKWQNEFQRVGKVERMRRKHREDPKMNKE